MIRIVRKGNNLHRNNEYFQIQVNGKTFKTDDGVTSYWTEADALRAAAQYFGTVPQEQATYVSESDGDIDV